MFTNNPGNQLPAEATFLFQTDLKTMKTISQTFAGGAYRTSFHTYNSHTHHFVRSHENFKPVVTKPLENF
jgi:hypothetical protein